MGISSSSSGPRVGADLVARLVTGSRSTPQSGKGHLTEATSPPEMAALNASCRQALQKT